MSIFADPKLFNYVLLSLHLGASVRWGFEGRWWDVGYWLAAAWITALMTWRPEQ
jgi:hypothetical protein